MKYLDYNFANVIDIETKTYFLINNFVPKIENATYNPIIISY